MCGSCSEMVKYLNVGGFRLLNIRRKSYRRIYINAVVSGRDVDNRIGY